MFFSLQIEINIGRIRKTKLIQIHTHTHQIHSNYTKNQMKYKRFKTPFCHTRLNLLIL